SQLKKYKTQLQQSHFKSLNGNLKQSDLITHIPSRELADTLVHLYLTTFEPAYRILHVPSFWKEYHALWASPDSAAVGSTIKLFMIMAIGSCFFEEDLELSDYQFNPQKSAINWIQIAQSWLSTPFDKA